MKTSKKTCIIYFLLVLGYGCNSTPNKNTELNSEATWSDDSKTSEETGAEPYATCLWPKVGLRDNPGRKDAKYITTIYFGEKVEFLDEKQIADDDKEYIKVKLSDGNEGWVYKHLFAIGGKLGIVNGQRELYKRPDIMTYVGEKLEPMDMVVIFDGEQDGWNEVVSLKKEKKGWIQGQANIIQNELDVKLGILYWRAMEEGGDKKYELLENIMDNPNFKKSKLIEEVSKALYGNPGSEEAFYIDELDQFQNLPSNKLGIISKTVNIMDHPTTSSEEVIFQVKKGDICDIIEQSSSLEEVNGNTDRWYKINFNGKVGWVFGHHTSKKRN